MIVRVSPGRDKGMIIVDVDVGAVGEQRVRLAKERRHKPAICQLDLQDSRSAVQMM